jgi:hypothetical protein
MPDPPHRTEPAIIGGRFRPAHATPITVTDPSIGEAIAEVAAAVEAFPV